MATKSVSLSGVSLLALGLSFCPGQAASCSTNNGNLLSQTISHAQIGTSGQPDYEAAFSQTQLYTTYDEVNRLVSFSEGSGVRRGYGYDRYGNHWVDVDPAKSAGLPLSPLTPSGTAVTGPNWYSGGNNRMTGVGYDAAGHQTQLSPFTLGYDAEGKQSNAVSASNGSAAYEYDGEGRRVRKWLCPNGGACSALTVGAQKTQYVYDAFGQLAAEYGGTVSGAGVSYVSTDHLGSTRLRTNGQGGVEARYDYLPFGEQMGAGVNGRSAKHASGVYPAPSDGRSVLFTGKERDAETGLDYFGARYLSAAQGRFTSPDKLFADQDEASPQSWNLYAYTRNNPLRYVDRTGLAIETPWDAFNAGLDAVSLASNVASGNVVGALVDGAGLAYDVAATLIPGLPGGAGTMLKALRAADNLVDAGQTVKRGSTVLENAKRGKAFEQQAVKAVRKEETGVVEQLTVKTQSGVKVRLDTAGRDASGNVALADAKGSAEAGLTKNQKKAYPEIERSGATVVGKGRPGFPPGTQIPPTRVRIIRPEDLKKMQE